jgi:hypothetical protein
MLNRVGGMAPLLALSLVLAACDSSDDEPAVTDPVVEDAAPAEDADAAGAAEAVIAPAFGIDEDVAYAASLWAALGEAALAGEQSIQAPFYEGAEPHGFVLETIFAELTLNGFTAPIIVKRNYGPEGITVGEVANDPAAHLAAITVMYKRPNFNADNDDWFWVKYLPDGTLDVAGENAMAGNVGGCIGCHTNAPGDDWIFVTDRALSDPVAVDVDDAIEGGAVRDVFGGDPP